MGDLNGLKRNAVICILRSGDKYLFLERKKMPNQGRWVPIGGKVDPYESPTDAAKREIYEEAGVVVDYLKVIGVLCETSPIEYNWNCFVYLSEVPFFEPPICDEGNLAWLTIDEIKKLDTPPTTIPIFEALLNNKYFIFEAKYNDALSLLSLINHIV